MSPTQTPALAALPTTWQTVLRYLKTRGDATAEDLATAAAITLSGVRQHLTALERDGLVTHTEPRASTGTGRPRYLYTLTPTGDALFPRAYAELTNELLHYVEDEDPALLTRLFDRRAQRRLEQCRARTEGLPFPERVSVVARILDEDGYLADFTPRDDGAFVITEHNCAVLSVAKRYSLACSSELAFLQAALPDATVARIAHRLNGAHVCAYEVRPRA